MRCKSSECKVAHFAHMPGALPAFEPVVVDPRRMKYRPAGYLEFSNILGAEVVKVIRAESAPAGATLFAPHSGATPRHDLQDSLMFRGLLAGNASFPIPFVVSQIPAQYFKLTGGNLTFRSALRHRAGSEGRKARST